MSSVQLYMRGPFNKETYWKIRTEIKKQQDIRAGQKILRRPPVNLRPLPNKLKELDTPKGSATALHVTNGYQTARGTSLSKRIREGDKKRALKLKHPESK